jgi:NAD(P)-dependent dehydrogenase (short-subunit alcohol dehydrogenase family)
MHSVMVICVGLGIGLSVARRFAHEGLPVAGVRVRRKGDVSAA